MHGACVALVALALALLDSAAMIGEVVGNYEVLRCIGKGGMGAVYLARHRLIGRRAAIKVLLSTANDDEMVQRFFNEARSTSDVKHAGLIDVFDFGYHNGNAYIAMEYLEGESLAARLQRERATLEVTIGVARQVASALAAAHAHGIVHRDLKPDNIFLSPDDEAAIGVRAKVLDFGIAKLSGEAAGVLKTRTNTLMGTPAYMSPEQCRGAGLVDARSDIYSLGCILFEMATGRRPFVADGLGEMMMAHMAEEPPRPRDIDPAVPEWLEDVILRTLAKEPAERFPSMEALGTLLAQKARELVQPPQAVALGTPPAATLRGAIAEATARRNTPARITPPRPTPVAHSAVHAQSVAPTVTPTQPRRATRWILLAAAGAAALGVAAFMLVGKRTETASVGTTEQRPSDSGVITVDAAAAPVAATGSAAPPPDAATPATVTLIIESDPTGADVYDAEGARLGRTPLTFARPQTASTLELVLKASGRKPATARLSLAHDDSVRVELDRARTQKGSAATAPATTTEPTTTTPAPAFSDGTIDPFAKKKGK